MSLERASRVGSHGWSLLRRWSGGCGGRLDGLQDEVGRGLWLGNERDVGIRDLHDRGFRALSHEPLEGRRDRLVLGTDQIPARQRIPGWGCRRRGCERRGGIW